jgi:hypothetical protein
MEAAVIAVLVLYFLPWLVAATRGHNNSMAIFMLNLFLGWTFLGWVAALVWALTNSSAQNPPKISLRQPPLQVETPKTCQYCMALNSRAFRHCSECGNPLPR